MTQDVDPYADVPEPADPRIREDRPTLAGLPDDAPDELRWTLSGGDPDQLPVEDTEPPVTDR